MRHAFSVFVVALAGAVPVAAVSDPGGSTPEQIVAHHLSTSASGDLEGVLGDYADTAVVIAPGGKTQGKDAIRKTFSRMFAGPPASRAPIEVTQKYFTSDVGYIVWVQNAGKPEEVRGSDTFLVRKGKIVTQTVAVVPMHPPAK